MTLTEYLSNYWGLVILTAGMTIVLRSDIHLERGMVKRIFIANIMLLFYSITSYMETYLGNQTEYTILRPILSAVDYSLVAFILALIITIAYPVQKIYLYIPAVLNAVLCFISIKTKIVFYINEENHFMRGPLGYLTYFITALYLAYLIYNSFANSKMVKEDIYLLVFMSLTSVLCLIVPLLTTSDMTQWFTITIGIDIMLYYIYLLQSFTKRDPLTKLMNRQSCYADSEKYMESITAVVTMDMNGLKEINDNEGHIAGDTALKALADCFWKAAEHGQRVYRIGGDEFVMLCLGTKESEVISLVERIKQETAKTPYTCAVGYAMKEEGITIDKLYKKADEMLYDDKRRYYIESGKDRRKRR